jgi:tRNA A37 threonylcarbamoyladenosine synthetase subunit TsaC/SUA5/YrdC
MFGKKKAEENRFIIAVKDYSNTAKALKDGTISLPYDAAIYQKMLDEQTSKVDNLKDLKKFIKLNNKAEKEVKHFWEGLIVEGYTLVNVKYAEKLPTMQQLCSKELFKFVCAA